MALSRRDKPPTIARGNRFFRSWRSPRRSPAAEAEAMLIRRSQPATTALVIEQARGHRLQGALFIVHPVRAKLDIYALPVRQLMNNRSRVNNNNTPMSVPVPASLAG